MTVIGGGIAFERGGQLGYGDILQPVPETHEKSGGAVQRPVERRPVSFGHRST